MFYKAILKIREVRVGVAGYGGMSSRIAEMDENKKAAQSSSV